MYHLSLPVSNLLYEILLVCLLVIFGYYYKNCKFNHSASNNCIADHPAAWYPVVVKVILLIEYMSIELHAYMSRHAQNFSYILS